MAGIIRDTIIMNSVDVRSEPMNPTSLVLITGVNSTTIKNMKNAYNNRAWLLNPFFVSIKVASPNTPNMEKYRPVFNENLSIGSAK